MASKCLLLLWLVVICRCSEAYRSYNHAILDFFTSLESDLRNKRSDVRRDDPKMLFYQDALSPFLDRRPAASNLRKRSEPPTKTSACQERSNIKYKGKGTATLNVRFPATRTRKDDEYMCTGFKVPFGDKESFIVKFTPHADMDQTHHMLVYGCHDLNSKTTWNCVQPCEKKQTLYAWARNAPELSLPKDVGYSVGEGSGIRYIVVQMHFAKKLSQASCSGVTAEVTTNPQKYYAGIFLLGSPEINLPPHTYNVDSTVLCDNEVKKPMHVFAFRTHAHALANVITGYRLREGKYTMLGKGNPKWPQSFYPRVGGEIELRPGDILAARCSYNNTRDHYVFAGPSGSDEMCNLYLMFYTADKRALNKPLECWGLPPGVQESQVTLPNDVSELAPYPGYAGEDSRKAVANRKAKIPPTPEEHLHSHMSSHGDGEDNKVAGEEHQDGQEMMKKMFPGEKPEFQAPQVHVNETLSRSHGMPESQGLEAQLDWPHLGPDFKIGSVGGLVADRNGNLHVFHRADRLWTQTSFDSQNRFTEQNNPIMEDTVYHISKDAGEIIHAWGRKQFFMPHGISLDADDNMWLTDVALHQVLKYPPGGADKPLMALGERFVPGSNIYHFCKPTDVAVDEDGMIYVSDGYCNGRVMKFAPDGSFIKKWGRMVTSEDLLFHDSPPPRTFFVVHNIILCGPEMDELCVADRENGRIQCFDRNGNFRRVIQDKARTGKRVFAIAYSPLEGGVLYGVNGPSAGDRVEVGGFTVQYDSGEVMDRWEPSPGVMLTDPHDITASPSGRNVYVGDLTSKKVFKFDNNPSEISPAQEEALGEMENSQEQQDEEIDKKSKMTPEEPDGEKEVKPGNAEGGHPGISTRVEIISRKKESSPEGGAATIIIIILLILPTIAILTAFICVRVRAKRLKEYEGLLSSNSKSASFYKNSSLNLGKFLKRSPDQKGFTMVRSEPSDEEDDGGSDSDVEVYSKKEQPEGDEGQRQQ